jgi:hypothetical protein
LDENQEQSAVIRIRRDQAPISTAFAFIKGFELDFKYATQVADLIQSSCFSPIQNKEETLSIPEEMTSAPVQEVESSEVIEEAVHEVESSEVIEEAVPVESAQPETVETEAVVTETVHVQEVPDEIALPEVQAPESMEEEKMNVVDPIATEVVLDAAPALVLEEPEAPKAEAALDNEALDNSEKLLESPVALDNSEKLLETPVSMPNVAIVAPHKHEMNESDIIAPPMPSEEEPQKEEVAEKAAHSSFSDPTSVASCILCALLALGGALYANKSRSRPSMASVVLKKKKKN